jgi:hypothetical protein
MQKLEPVGSVDLTPTPEGFMQIAMAFGDSIIGDVEDDRRDDSKKLLAELIGIAGWLGSAGHSNLVGQLKDRYNP